MKRNLFSVKLNSYQKNKIPFPENYSGAILYQNFLNQNLEGNKKLKLGSEIKKKKQEIFSMFRKNFGRHFLNVKPDSLILFQKNFGQFLFDPDSQFLARLPKLQRRLKHEKKISELKLKDKIDMGAMVYYDLKTKDKKQNRHLSMAKEKMLTISRNFESAASKDLVESGFYKVKFWNENKKKIENYFKKNLLQINNYIEEQNEDNSQKSNINDSSDNSSYEQKEKEESNEKSSINNSMINDFKQKEIQNVKLVLYEEPENKPIPNKNPININKTEVVSKNKRKNIENINKTDLKKNKKIIKSYNAENVIPKLISNNKSRNITNFSNAFRNSNIFKNISYNVSQSKINESNNSNSNFLKTTTNFNLSNSKGFTARTSIVKRYSLNKYSQKKKVPSLKNKHYKFKNNLNNLTSKLNQCTNKCNIELIKLIDINNDDNFAERKKKYLNRNKLNMKEILIEKKEIKKTELDDENDKDESENNDKTEKIKEAEKDSFRSVLQGARKDLKDKFGGKLEAHNKEKMFKKKIIHITDEQALDMVEDFLEKEKELDIRKIMETDSRLQLRQQRQMIAIRTKTKENYDKMLRLKNQLIIDKGKIFKELEKYDIN